MDESRKFFVLLLWKKGGALTKKKEKKVKKRKYILMNPARFAPHPRVVHVWFTPLRNYAPRGARDERDKLAHVVSVPTPTTHLL